MAEMVANIPKAPPHRIMFSLSVVWSVKAITIKVTEENNGTDLYVALYPYVSEDPNKLNFETGQVMNVIKKDGQWWSAQIEDRTGLIPYNYVRPADKQAVSVNGVGCC